MAPTLVSSLRIGELIIASIILITVHSGHSIGSPLTSGGNENDSLHDNTSQKDETWEDNYRSEKPLNYGDKHLSIFYDYEMHFIAHKDAKLGNCYLEKMQHASLDRQKWRWHSSSPRTLYVSLNSLTKLEAWRLAGGRIVNFCSGTTISRLQETKPVPNWSDDPFFNEIPEDENDITQRRVREVLLTPLLERAKRKTLLENREALDSKGKEKWGVSQGQRRNRRQAPPSPYRGRFRGQTQSQYLNVDGDSQKEGRATAEATHDSSHAIVSGSSGMGQAQSMSAGGLGCDGCPPASAGGGALYPDAAIQSRTKDVVPTGGRYANAGPPFTQVGSQGYPGAVGPSPGDHLGTRPFSQTIEPGKPWISPSDTQFTSSTFGIPGTTGSGTGSGTGTGSQFYSNPSGRNEPFPDLYPANGGGKRPSPSDRIVYPNTPGSYHPGNNAGIQTSGAGLYPDTSVSARGQPVGGGVGGNGGIGGSPVPGSVPSQTFYPSLPGKDVTQPYIPGSDQGGRTNLPGAGSPTHSGSGVGGNLSGTSSQGTVPGSHLYPGSPGSNVNSGRSYPAGIPPVSAPRESAFYPNVQGETRVPDSGYSAYYPGGAPPPSEPYFDGRSRGVNGEVQNNRNAGIYPGIPNEGQRPTYPNVPYSGTDARGTYPGSSSDSNLATSHPINSNFGREAYGRQSSPPSGPSVPGTSYPGDYGGTATGSNVYTGAGGDGAQRGGVYPAHSIPSGYPGMNDYPSIVNGQMPVTPQGKPGIAGTGGAGGIEGTRGMTGISGGGVDGTGMYRPSMDEIAATGFPYPPSPVRQDQRYFGQPGGTGSNGAGVRNPPGTVGVIGQQGTAGGGGFYPGPQSGIVIPTEGRGTILYPDGTIVPGVGQPGATSRGTYDAHDSRATANRDQYYNQPSGSQLVYPRPSVDGNTGVTTFSGAPQNYPVNGQGTLQYPTNVPGRGGGGGGGGGQEYSNGVGGGLGGLGTSYDTTGATDGRHRDGNVDGLPPPGLGPNQPSNYYRGPGGNGVGNGALDPSGNYGLVPGSGYETNGGPGSARGVGATDGTGGATGIGADGRTLAAGSNVEADADADSQASTSVKQAEKGGTQASASAQGTYGGGTAQSEVSGTYSGSGSFSAQAGTSDANKSAQTQVSGGKEGAASNAQGVGGRGKSQSQVQLNSETGATSTGAQSSGWNHGSNSQVQASSKGGMADAQANGEGSTSSQAQIGFQPYLNRNSDPNGRHEKDEQQRPFRGGGTASAQSGTYRGQSQSQIQGSFLYGISYTGAAQAGSGSGAAASRKPFNFSTTDQPLFKKFEPFDAPSASARDAGTFPTSDDLNVNSNLEESQTAIPQDIQNQSVNNTAPSYERVGPDDRTLQTSSSQRKAVTVPVAAEKEEKPSVWPSGSKDAAYEGGTPTDDYEYDDEDDYDSSVPPNAPRTDLPAAAQRHQDPSLSNAQNNNDGEPQNAASQKFDYDAEHDANSNAQLAHHERLNGNKDSANNHYSTHVPQDPAITIPREGDVLQSGQSLPGFTVPPGFRGRITSAPEPAEASDARKSQSSPAPNLQNRESHGNKDPASQTRSLRTYGYRGRTSSTQREYFLQPESRMQRPPSHSVPNSYLRANSALNPNSDADPDTDSPYGRPQRPNYYTVTNSVAGKMDDNNGSRNAARKYEHRYYTKSSTCGYFTFSCNIVHGSNGRTKICKPKVPTNPDGSPLKC